MTVTHWAPRFLGSRPWATHLDGWCFRLRESAPRKEGDTVQSRAAKEHLLEVLTPVVSIVSGKVIILHHRPSLQSLNKYLSAPTVHQASCLYLEKSDWMMLCVFSSVASWLDTGAASRTLKANFLMFSVWLLTPRWQVLQFHFSSSSQWIGKNSKWKQGHSIKNFFSIFHKKRKLAICPKKIF